MKPSEFISLKTQFEHQSTINNSIVFIALTLWIFLCYKIILTIRANESDKFITSFFPVMIVVMIYPIIYYGQQVYITSQQIKNKADNIDPYYPICLTGYKDLNLEEQAQGFIAKMDYSCHKDQYNFLRNTATEIATRGYTIIYILFVFTCWFIFNVRSTGGTKRFKIMKRNNPVGKILIQIGCLMSLFVMNITILSYYYYPSNFVFTFFQNILQLNVAVMLILLTYIIFQLLDSYF